MQRQLIRLFLVTTVFMPAAVGAVTEEGGGHQDRGGGNGGPDDASQQGTSRQPRPSPLLLNGLGLRQATMLVVRCIFLCPVNSGRAAVFVQHRSDRQLRSSV